MKDPRLTHSMDQFGGALTEMAAVFGRYFVELREHGFDRNEAMTMVLEAQQAVMSPIVPILPLEDD